MSGTDLPLQDVREGGSEGYVGDVHVEIDDGESTGLRHRPSARSEREEELMNRLPSRQLAEAARHVMAANTWKKKSKKRRPGYHTVRLNHAAHTQDEVHQLASDLMGDEDFVDAPERLQNEEIRELPTTISNKKAVKEEVKQRRRKEKKPGVFKTMGYSASLAWKRFNQNLDELTYSLELWAGHLKKIDGNFGSGVTSYFLFIKWLFLINIPLFFLVFAFVVLPQLLYRYDELGGYVNNTVSFKFEHIFTGSGWLNETELYYGSYTNGDVGVISGLSYEMQYAYFFTLVIYYGVILVVTAASAASSYRRNYIEASDAFNFYYVSKVFCGWSFSMDNPGTAALKHKSIFKEFQEYLSGFRREEEKQSCEQWCSLFLLRVMTNMLVLMLLAGSGYLVWYISITQSLSNKIAFLSEMALPLCISLVNFVLPFAFSILASFEKYKSPRTELYMTMIRTITLNVVTLGVLIYFWYSSVDCSKRERDDEWLDSELECKPCWENFMGENIYRLVIVDFIFTLVVTFLSEFVRRLMSQFCCKSLGRPEFNIGRNTLNLIYSQGLIWLGVFYCPLLPFIMAFKLLVIFYVKRFSVMQNCVPSVKPWRGGRTHTVIMGLMLVFYILCLVAVAASMVTLTPSVVCGPYQGYNASYEVVTNILDDWKTNNPNANGFITLILEILTSVAFAVFLAITICVIAHYSRVVSKGYEEMVALLRKQIALEGKDKAFLLKLLQQATRDLPPEVPYAAIPYEHGGGEPVVTPAGGRLFAKHAVGRVEHIAHNTPPSQRRRTTPKAVPGTSSSAASTPMNSSSLSSHHNPSFIQQSHDMSGSSSHLAPTSPAADSSNPAYSEHSSGRRPNLPFPSQYMMSPGDERL